MAINGERPKDDGGFERAVWYGRSMETFNEEGKGIVRFYREVIPDDDTLLYFCPIESNIEAQNTMKKFPNKRWFTFYEAGRYVIAEREMMVSVSEVIILEPDSTETKMIWTETRKCKKCVWSAQAWKDSMSCFPQNYTFGVCVSRFQLPVRRARKGVPFEHLSGSFLPVRDPCGLQGCQTGGQGGAASGLDRLKSIPWPQRGEHVLKAGAQVSHHDAPVSALESRVTPAQRLMTISSTGLM